MDRKLKIILAAAGGGAAAEVPTFEIAGAVPPDITFTHPANCIIEYILTTMPTIIINTGFRLQDSDNKLFAYHAGGNYLLFKNVATIDTLIAGGLCTQGNKLIIALNGQSVQFYNGASLVVDQTVPEFSTATGGYVYIVDGVISNLKVWNYSSAKLTSLLNP